MQPPHDNWFATTSLLRRFRCDECGYGAARRTEPARCPMCGGAGWAEEPWRPTELLVDDLDPALMPMRREADAIGFLPGVPLS